MTTAKLIKYYSQSQMTEGPQTETELARWRRKKSKHYWHKYEVEAEERGRVRPLAEHVRRAGVYPCYSIFWETTSSQVLKPLGNTVYVSCLEERRKDLTGGGLDWFLWSPQRVKHSCDWFIGKDSRTEEPLHLRDVRNGLRGTGLKPTLELSLTTPCLLYWKKAVKYARRISDILTQILTRI